MRNRCRTSNSPISNIFIPSEDIRRRTLKLTEIRPNFAYFWPLKIFWGGSPKILDRDYKIECSSKHRAKFCADRPTKLKDYARKKKEKEKEMPAKLKSDPQAIASERINYAYYSSE